MVQLLRFYKFNRCMMHIMPAAEYCRSDVIFSITLKLGMSFQPQEPPGLYNVWCSFVHEHLYNAECWNVGHRSSKSPMSCFRSCSTWSWTPWPLFKDTVMIRSLYMQTLAGEQLVWFALTMLAQKMSPLIVPIDYRMCNYMQGIHTNGPTLRPTLVVQLQQLSHRMHEHA